MSSDAETASGFHGKLVAKGDFVTRRLPRSFVGPWDSWLQDVIGGSRARMGEAWLDAYLTSPIWRFALPAGLCGESAAAGVLMPSVDRVGRYFPLTIAAVLADGADILGVPVAAADWFGKAEELARSALADGFDFDAFDAAVAALGIPAAGEMGSIAGGAAVAEGGSGLCLAISSTDAVAQVYRQLAGRFLNAAYPRCSLWWASGAEGAAGTFIGCSGLPPVEGFAAFLDGRWGDWGWDGAAPVAPAAPAEAAASS
jgi:type VI secretion system protein ImpM